LTPDDKGYRSEILFLRLNNNGNPERVVTAKNVITSNLHETIESFRITGYDKDESKSISNHQNGRSVMLSSLLNYRMICLAVFISLRYGWQY
jgi:hypothetical protein